MCTCRTAVKLLLCTSEKVQEHNLYDKQYRHRTFVMNTRPQNNTLSPIITKAVSNTALSCAIRMKLLASISLQLLSEGVYVAVIILILRSLLLYSFLPFPSTLQQTGVQTFALFYLVFNFSILFQVFTFMSELKRHFFKAIFLRSSVNLLKRHIYVRY